MRLRGQTPRVLHASLLRDVLHQLKKPVGLNVGCLLYSGIGSTNSCLHNLMRDVIDVHCLVSGRYIADTVLTD